MVPLLRSHSMTMTACESAETTLLRSMKRKLRGGVPSGYSLARQPAAIRMWCARPALEAGATRSRPQGKTATVIPPACKQARWAAVSQPRARPLMTAKPERLSFPAKAAATERPAGEGRRVPTTATAGRVSAADEPRTKSGRPAGEGNESETACALSPSRLTSSPGNSTQKIQRAG